MDVEDHRQELQAGERSWSGECAEGCGRKRVPGAELLSSRPRLEPEGDFSGEHSGEEGGRREKE